MQIKEKEQFCMEEILGSYLSKRILKKIDTRHAHWRTAAKTYWVTIESNVSESVRLYALNNSLAVLKDQSLPHFAISFMIPLMEHCQIRQKSLI